MLNLSEECSIFAGKETDLFFFFFKTCCGQKSVIRDCFIWTNELIVSPLNLWVMETFVCVFTK